MQCNSVRWCVAAIVANSDCCNIEWQWSTFDSLYRQSALFPHTAAACHFSRSEHFWLFPKLLEVRSGACVCVCYENMWKCSYLSGWNMQPNCLGRIMSDHIDDDWMTSTNINELVEMKIGFNGIDMAHDKRHECLGYFSIFFSFFILVEKQNISNLFPCIQKGRRGCNALAMQRFVVFFINTNEAQKSMPIGKYISKPKQNMFR